jgi:pilus assembly protein Flp/PilA
MQKFISLFSRDERGVTALEYGLIAALIAVAIIGAVGTLGKNASAVFATVASSL